MKRFTTVFLLSSLCAIFEAKIIDKSDVIFPGKVLPTKSQLLQQRNGDNTPVVNQKELSNVVESSQGDKTEGPESDPAPLVSVKLDRTSYKGHHHGNQHGHNHGHKDSHHGNVTDRREYRREKKTSRLKDSDARRVWKKLSKDQPRLDNDPCKPQKCKKKTVCMVNGDTGKAECIARKLLRQRQKYKKTGKGPHKKTGKKYYKTKSGHQKKNRPSSYIEREKGKHVIKKLKHEAESFRVHKEEKKRHRLHHMRQHKHQEIQPNKIAMAPRDKMGGKSYKTGQRLLNSIKNDKTCSAKELSQMSSRLLDWFKVLQDQDIKDHEHVIQKRNSMKKDLHEQGECICQAPVRYEFLVMDTEEDNILSAPELERLEANGYEHCITPFVLSCDHNHDGQLSDKEWCCCFADVLPPCLAKMEKIPSQISLGKPSVLPGAMVPQCDEDGFYKPLQCHASTGYCWCVDRNGVEIPDTSTQGTIDCEHLDEISKEDFTNLHKDLD